MASVLEVTVINCRHTALDFQLVSIIYSYSAIFIGKELSILDAVHRKVHTVRNTGQASSAEVNTESSYARAPSVCLHGIDRELS
jgi:hypothetical protein